MTSRPSGPGANLTINGTSSVVQLIKQLKYDFGRDFVVTLAPVADDMIYENQTYFSGFSYFDLEKEAVYDDGSSMIDWYNAQFVSCSRFRQPPDMADLVSVQWVRQLQYHRGI